MAQKSNEQKGGGARWSWWVRGKVVEREREAVTETARWEEGKMEMRLSWMDVQVEV